MNILLKIIIFVTTTVHSSVIHHGHHKTSTISTFSTHLPIKKESLGEAIHEKPVQNSVKVQKQVQGADSSHACQIIHNIKHCIPITEYSIPPNVTLSCKSKLLLVVFDFFNVDTNETNEGSLFLAQNGSFQENQEFTKQCYKIRRYYVNWHKSLIFLLDRLHLLENDEIDEIIDTEFFRYSMFLWLIYKTNLYNEEQDTFKLIEFLKINGLILIVSIFIYYMMKLFGLLLKKYFDKMYVQHCSELLKKELDLLAKKKKDK